MRGTIIMRRTLISTVIRLFFLVLIIVNSVYLFTIVFNSRPSADEFLLAAFINGYYVDALSPEGMIFEPTGKLFYDYFSATKAAFLLGWDSPLNFTLYNYIPALLLNKFGSISSSIVALYSQSILLFCLYILSKLFTNDLKSRFKVVIILLTSFYLFLITANYGPEKEFFGIFALTGIRFSTYWLQPIITITCLAFVITKISNKLTITKKSYLIFILLPNIVTFWSSSYWVTMLIILLILIKINGLKEYSTYLIRGIILSTTIIVLNLYPVLNPTVNATRLSIENANSFTESIKLFIFRIIAYAEAFSIRQVMSNVLTVSLVIAFVAGILISIVVTKSNSILLKSGRKEDNVTKHLVQRSTFLSLFALPFVFSFQEFMSYPAWWHKTTPYTFIFFGVLFFGFNPTKKLELYFYKVKQLFVLLFIIILLLTSHVVLNSLRVLNNFSESWDSGNYLSIGSPLENRSKYMYDNILRVYPYKLKYRDDFKDFENLD
jgi:hypothetical protein